MPSSVGTTTTLVRSEKHAHARVHGRKDASPHGVPHSGHAPSSTTRRPETREGLPADRLTSKFVVSLYRREGAVRGTIELLGSDPPDSSAFEGLDGPAIMDFLSLHCPPPTAARWIEPGVRDQERSRDALPRGTREAPSVRSMTIVHAGASKPTRVLRQNERFEVRLRLDVPEAGPSAREHLRFTARVYGHELGSVTNHIVGEADGALEAQGLVVVPIGSLSLTSPGIWRLTAVVTAGQPREGTEPLAVVAESELITVY